MTWTGFAVAFRLESPLHVGYRQVGMLAQTRFYLPGKNLWAAATERLAKMTASGFPEYREVGEFLQRASIFTYCFVSESERHDERICLPVYQENGLRWGCFLEEEFGSRFLTSFTTTALAPESRTAEDGALHDVEAIGNRTGDGGSVYLVGHVVLEGVDPSQPTLRGVPLSRVLETLHIGGERRYGFGRLRLVDDPVPVTNVWGIGFDQFPEATLYPGTSLLGHLSASPGQGLKGNIEFLAGRDWGTGGHAGPGQRLSTHRERCWVPGSRVTENLPVRFNYDGTLIATAR